MQNLLAKHEAICLKNNLNFFALEPAKLVKTSSMNMNWFQREMVKIVKTAKVGKTVLVVKYVRRC